MPVFVCFRTQARGRSNNIGDRARTLVPNHIPATHRGRSLPTTAVLPQPLQSAAALRLLLSREVEAALPPFLLVAQAVLALYLLPFRL